MCICTESLQATNFDNVRHDFDNGDILHFNICHYYFMLEF